MAAALVVSACSGGSGTGGSHTNAADPNATFRFIFPADVSSFDKDKITSNTSDMFLWPVYDCLVHVDSDGNPQPELASSWKVSPDGKSITFTLIKNWHYADGTPFDAASVKANLVRSMTLPGSFNKGPLSSVSGIDVVNTNTITLNTQSSANPLINLMGSSAGMMMSPKVFNSPDLGKNPIGGSGAFTMTHYVSGAEADYTAVKDYWDPGALKIHKLVILVSNNDAARLNAVKTGQADATALVPSQQSEAAADKDLTAIAKPVLTTLMLYLNTTKSKFSNQLVRQALMYSIDRKALASSILNGQGSPVVSVFPSFYWAGSNDPSPTDYAYNPAKAKQLLARAGLPDGFSFTAIGNNLNPYVQLAEAMQQQMLAAGIHMKFTQTALANVATDFAVNKGADAAILGFKGDPDPSTTVGNLYLSGGFYNPGGFSNPQATALANQALIGTQAQRATAYHKLMQLEAQLVPSVPVVNISAPLVADKKVHGLQTYVDASRQFRGVWMSK